MFWQVVIDNIIYIVGCQKLGLAVFAPILDSDPVVRVIPSPA
jgi:hypothetical protein